jgi:hypothetical protein
MPAQSPTLSPTLSAITAGLRGSSSGNAGLDLAHEVGAHVGALGEDAAAQTREDRDQRRAEREPDQRVRGVLGIDLEQHHVVAGHAQQAQAHHQHAGDRAAAERHGQRGIDPAAAASAVRTLARTDTFMPM